MAFLNQEFSSGFSTPNFTPGASSTAFSDYFKNYKDDSSDAWRNFAPPGAKSAAPTQEDPDKNVNAARLDALNKAFTWASMQRQNSGTNTSTGGVSGGGVQQAGDLTFAYPMMKQTTRTTAGSSGSGLGPALGTLAGIGASFIPGLGPGIAAAMPAIGGNIGSLFS
jgi:hypothetical protein